MPTKDGGECPYCGSVAGHLNNHVRMSKDGGHGPYREYPDGWDKEAKEATEGNGPSAESSITETQPQSDGATTDDETPGVETVVDDETDETGPTPIGLEDEIGDTRSYDCECGTDLEYHAEACPDCATDLAWRGVEA